MPRNRKLYINKQTHFVSFRAEENLPLPPIFLINQILESIICRAATLYPVDTSGFIFMSNHCHMLITVINPEHVDSFVQYIKRESAHAINKLLGRRKHTIWCDGYDSPQVLDEHKAIDMLIYLYTNPQSANLVESIEEYPGLSSWNMFKNEDYELKRRRIPRSSIKRVANKVLSKSYQKKVVSGYDKELLEENSFKLKPFAFLDSFPTKMSKGEARELIIKGVRSKERLLSADRRFPVMGVRRLESQVVNAEYESTKFSKRMICLSSFREARVEFISWYRDLCRQAYEAYRKWRTGARNVLFPPGMFSPDGRIQCNLVPT